MVAELFLEAVPVSSGHQHSATWFCYMENILPEDRDYYWLDLTSSITSVVEVEVKYHFCRGIQ